MILVAGGTGRLGREVIRRLRADGQRVRVLTRSAERAAGLAVDGLANDGLADEVAVGDVRAARTLAPAVDGCAAVVSAFHGFLGGRGAGPEEIDMVGNGNLADAAERAGVERFVLMSVLGAAADHPMLLFRMKNAAEQRLRESAMAWTVVRASAFFESWLEILGGRVGQGGPAMVFGRGRNPINFVSVLDVAGVVVDALRPDAPARRVEDVAGPADFTMTEIAEALHATKTRHIPRPALQVMSRVVGPINPALARQAAAALVMDSYDMTADPALIDAARRRSYRTLADVLADGLA